MIIRYQDFICFGTSSDTIEYLKLETTPHLYSILKIANYAEAFRLQRGQVTFTGVDDCDQAELRIVLD